MPPCFTQKLCSAAPALGYLPKRFETLKKSIKVAKQTPAEVPKIRDFEYERIENIKLALLHFFNAQMYLHAKALELYAKAYDTMRQVNVKTEFREADQGTLRQVLTACPQVIGTPRATSNSARSGGGGDSHRGHSSSGMSPNPRPPSAAQQRPGSGAAQGQQQLLRGQ